MGARDDDRLGLAAELAVLSLVGGAVTAGVAAAMLLRGAGLVLEAGRRALEAARP